MATPKASDRKACGVLEIFCGPMAESVQGTLDNPPIGQHRGARCGTGSLHEGPGSPRPPSL